MKHTPRDPIHTLQLNDKAKRDVFMALEIDQHKPLVGPNRRGLRVQYNVGTLVISISHPGGGSVPYAVVPRNISTRGLAFLHGRYLYPGSPVEVTMLDLWNEPLRVHGSILRCRHVKGVIHEASVIFDQRIDLRRFVRMSKELSERARRELGGKALVVEPCEEDRVFCQSALGEMGMAVITVGDAESAMQETAKLNFDLIMTEMSVEQEMGVSLISHLREKKYKGLIIGLSADTSDIQQASATDQGCNGLLAKPLETGKFEETVDQLVRAARAAAEQEVITSTLADDKRMQPLIAAFLEELTQNISRLQHAQHTQNRDTVYRICQQIRRTSLSLGFEILMEHAKRVVDLISASPVDATELASAIEQLIQTARRARA